MAKVNELSELILAELENYSEEVVQTMKKSVEKASQDCMEEIKSHITFKQNTGEYVKNFKLKKSYEDKNTLRKTGERVWPVN